MLNMRSPYKESKYKENNSKQTQYHTLSNQHKHTQLILTKHTKHMFDNKNTI